MESYLISKRLQELLNGNGYIDNGSIMILFEEYEQDKINKIELEESLPRTLLILGNKKLIFYVLKKEFGLISASEDLDEYAIGVIGLIKAIDSYKRDSGVRFITYAYRVIANEVRMHYRKIYTMKNYGEYTKISLDDNVRNAEGKGDDIPIKETIQDDSDFIDELCDKEQFRKIINNLKYLTEREAIVVIHQCGLFGVKPKNSVQIADILKISRPTISKTYTKALNKLRLLTLNDETFSNEQMKLKEMILKKGVQNNVIELFS